MSVAIQLVCEGCGRRTKEIVFDGTAPRVKVEDLRLTKGWSRSRPRVTESMRDLCPGCTDVAKARRNTRCSTVKGGE